MICAALLNRSSTQTAFRISPGDSNYFVILFDPAVEGFANICVIEIFRVGGRTPPNSHRKAHEFFYVLHGSGIAHSQGRAIEIAKGDALLLKPGVEHMIENTGPAKLYTLTIMLPDEDFAALIRAGAPVALDDEDRAVLGSDPLASRSRP